MGDVIGFNQDRNRSGSITFDELKQSVHDPELKERVETETLKLFSGAVQFKLPDIELYRQANTGPYGTLQPLPDRSRQIKSQIITHEKFPQFLNKEMAEKDEALKLAAASILAYAGICSWYKNLNPSDHGRTSRVVHLKSMLPSYPKLWEPIAYNAESDLVDRHVVLHRMAARVALNSAGVEDIDPVKPPFPVHIAALADPYANIQVAQIYNATRATH